MKKIFCALMLAILCVSACSCEKQSDCDLKISIYLGGYGKVWAQTLANEFMDEYGVQVEVEANPQLQSEIPSRLENGSDSDLLFSHGISWEMAAAQGQLESLDDVYSGIVEDNRTFESLLSEDYQSASSFKGHYYKVPWTNGVGGLVYNKVLFEKYGWEVPTTYAELTTLCETIYNAKIKVDPTDTKPNAATIKPFVWSSETYYWDYVVFNWWAQLAGMDEINAYKKLDTPEVFNPDTYPAKYQAVQAWVDLVAKHPEYSVKDSSGKQYLPAQLDFVNGYAAMMPNAQWLESEMRDSIDPTVCDMGIMKTPFMEGAKTDADGNPIDVDFTVGFGDSIVLPKKAKHKDMAKKFLLFLARKSSLKTFTEKTRGVMLAFDYSNVTIEGANSFMQSVYDINTQTQKFNLYSQSLLVIGSKINLEWSPDGIQKYADFYNNYNVADPSSASDVDVKGYFQSAYETIKKNWSEWNNSVNS